jgi:hypothetical protein
MAERIGRFVIYSADDEMPDCMCCDRCDSDFDCCNDCGPEYGWCGYRRTEVMGDME